MVDGGVGYASSIGSCLTVIIFSIKDKSSLFEKITQTFKITRQGLIHFPNCFLQLFLPSYNFKYLSHSSTEIQNAKALCTYNVALSSTNGKGSGSCDKSITMKPSVVEGHLNIIIGFS